MLPATQTPPWSAIGPFSVQLAAMRARAAMRFIPSVLQAAGWLVVCVGVAWAWPAAGVALLGVGLLLFGVALERD